MYEKIKSWISNNRFLVGMGVGAVLFLACTCSAEPAYMITESELVTLEQNSTRQLENQQEISAGITDSKGTADAIGSSIERSKTANRLINNHWLFMSNLLLSKNRARYIRISFGF